MAERIVFPYISNQQYALDSVARPFLPISLTLGENVAISAALLDSGADLNVLPFSLGIELGAVWTQHQPEHQLNGLTESLESRSIVLGNIPVIGAARERVQGITLTPSSGWLLTETWVNDA